MEVVRSNFLSVLPQVENAVNQCSFVGEMKVKNYNSDGLLGNSILFYHRLYIYDFYASAIDTEFTELAVTSDDQPT